MKDPLKQICANCGLSNGAHGAGIKVMNQCPMHEGYMDWPTSGITTFIPSGRYGTVPQGKKSKITQASQ